MKFEITMRILIASMIKIGIYFRDKYNRKISLFYLKHKTGHFVATPLLLSSKNQYNSANKTLKNRKTLNGGI